MGRGLIQALAKAEVWTDDAGCLALARTVHQRYGVAVVSIWRPMATWLAA